MFDGVKIFVKSANHSNNLDAELIAIGYLQDQISTILSESSGKAILHLGDKEIEPVSVEKTPGTPKSDFMITSKSGECIHISHKKGFSPAHFQQWGGITESEVARHPYTATFVTEMANMKELAPRTSIMVPIPDTKEGNDLKLMSVYGKDATKQVQTGPNKVDAVIQGMPTIAKSNHKYTLTSSNGKDSVHVFPSLPTGQYDPVFSLIYKGDRSQCGVKGARATITPVGGRKWSEVQNLSFTS